MENHGDRPEIIEALTGVTGQSTRYSSTLRQYMLYVAVPVRQEGQTIAVIRKSLPVTSISPECAGT